MNSPRFIRLTFSAACIAAAVSPVFAASVYWDVNGITAGGAAGTTATGTWSGADANWGNASGNIATAVWASGDSALFSAGTGVTGASTVTVSGSQTVGNITVDEGAITLTGGGLAFDTIARVFTVATGASLVINSNLTSSVGLTFKGTTTVNGNITSSASGNAIDVSNGATSGRLNLGSTANFTAASGALRVGVNGTASSTNAAAVYQSDSSQVTVSTLSFGITSGTGAVSSGYYQLGGTSTLTVANLALGLQGNQITSNLTTAVFDQTGGTATASTYVRIANTNAASGVMNITGGTFNFTGTGAINDSSFVVGYANGRGELNVGGTGTLNAGTTSLRLGGNATATGIVTLNSGGTITAGRVIDGGGDSTLNFNGGTLKATAATSGSNYFVAVDNAYVYAGGATVDSNGFNVTIAQALQAPAGNGVGTIAVTSGGSGYVGAPLVSITGGGGTGATGYAVMNAAGTAVVSIVITNPGTGYTSAPTITLIGGGGSGAVLDPAVLAANTSGALTKMGAGVLTLTGANTYAGDTFVNAGGVATGATGSFGSGDLHIVTGASLTLGNATSIADTALLFFSAGSTITLGSGTESLGNIVLGSTGIVASGLYTAAQLNSYFGLTGGNEVFFGGGSYDIAASAIPEPATWAALAGALALTGAMVARRSRCR